MNHYINPREDHITYKDVFGREHNYIMNHKWVKDSDDPLRIRLFTRYEIYAFKDEYCEYSVHPLNGCSSTVEECLHTIAEYEYHENRYNEIHHYEIYFITCEGYDEYGYEGGYVTVTEIK